MIDGQAYKELVYRVQREHSVEVLAERFDIDVFGILKNLEDKEGFSANEAAVHIGGFLIGMEYACQLRDEIL